MRSIILGIFFALSAVGCASSGPVPMGKETYFLSKSGDFFTFSASSVKADLFREAHSFCVGQGKELMPVNSTARDSGLARPAHAEIQFRCLKEGDPQLQRPTMEQAPDVKIDVRSK